MKKLILPVMILALTCPFPAANHASYIIHLENGGQLLTPQYWEEDNYVNFYIVGGTMGIEKNSVRKIERSTLDLDRIYEVKTPEKRPAQVEPKASMPGVTEKVQGIDKLPDAKEGEKKLSIADYKKYKDKLMGEIDRLLEEQREAASRGDSAAKAQIGEEIVENSNEVYKIIDEVKAINKGILPEGWSSR